MLTNSILRSVIRFSDENEAELLSNLYNLRREVNPVDLDGNILSFITDIFDKTQSIPSYTLVLKGFSERDDGIGSSGASRLETLASEHLPFITGADFRYELDKYKQLLLTDTLSSIVMDASNILTGGVKKKGVLVKGADDALTYIQTEISTLNIQLRRGSIEGSFRKEGPILKKKYEYLKLNPSDTVGVMTGIDKIDVVHRGARNGELILVAGFVSHLKTSFCINWLYRAAIEFGRNVAIASLESSIEVLRTLIYVMHSTHSKFQGNEPLDYEKVMAGALSPAEERFLDEVIADFQYCPDYGEIFYKEPEEGLTVTEIQRWAERNHKLVPLDLLVIDYLGLVDSGKNVSSLDSGSNLNKAIRQAKIMSLTFGQGRGIPVISPFQTNREGLKEAAKVGGKYQLTALANANEAERSADRVYTVYLDEVLRNSKELMMGNLKTRNGPLIQETFKVFADPSTRVIGNLDQSTIISEMVEI